MLAVAALVLGCQQGATGPDRATDLATRSDRVDAVWIDRAQFTSAGVRLCVLGTIRSHERCAEYARDFAASLADPYGPRRWGGPTDFDCRMALVAARRFASTERARLVGLCCPLAPFYARDDDGAPLCPGSAQ
jgi:hypothetical protein